MPLDITMCPGDGCPIRQDCYRYRAIPEGRQEWFGRLPFDATRGTCDQFWDVRTLAPTEAQIRERAYFLWLAAGKPADAADAMWNEAREALEHAARARLTP